jgi:hypothetical protein
MEHTQELAIQKIISIFKKYKKVMIEGSPGVGKSTILRKLKNMGYPVYFEIIPKEFEDFVGGKISLKKCQQAFFNTHLGFDEKEYIKERGPCAGIHFMKMSNNIFPDIIEQINNYPKDYVSIFLMRKNEDILDSIKKREHIDKDLYDIEYIERFNNSDITKIYPNCIILKM